MTARDGESKNRLYYGDNLDVLREHVASESVDLIYLDPPFNSNANYNVLFADSSGVKSSAQITAFEDTWHWGEESEKAFYDLVKSGSQDLVHLIEAYRRFLSDGAMMAYLAMMAPRLVELHRVLKPTGSIYLHCDPTASHYIKLLMDAIWGVANFKNEIVWQRTRAHNDRHLKRLGSVHDIILFYSKTPGYTWNRLTAPRDPEALKTHDLYRHTDGHLYRKGDCRAPGGRGPVYVWNGHTQNWRFTEEQARKLELEGKIVYSRTGMPRILRPVDLTAGSPLQDTWTDIDPPNSGSREALGYPTQKPVALLERILKASSNVDDFILDPFCGCGTAIHAAESLGRRWIGIDVTHLALTLIRSRLQTAFGTALSPYDTLGIPKDLAGAEALAQGDRYQFQYWALGLVEGRPANDKKKGADSGIDGFIHFLDDASGRVKSILVQVKSGHVTASQVRDLVGVVQREKAEIGLFITLQPPTEPMRQEAIKAGFYEPTIYGGRKFRKVQILTVAELLEGALVEYPRVAPVATFKRAARESAGEQAAFI